MLYERVSPASMLIDSGPVQYSPSMIGYRSQQVAVLLCREIWRVSLPRTTVVKFTTCVQEMISKEEKEIAMNHYVSNHTLYTNIPTHPHTHPHN